MNEPPGNHPEADVLCDLDEGLLGTASEADVQAHVAGCASCAGFIALLAATRAQLAALPAEPMPADVVERINAALASEAAREGASAPGTDAAVTPLRAARRSRRQHWLPGASAVAAGVALLLAGAVGIGALDSVNNESGTVSGAAEGAPAPNDGAARDTSSARNYTPATLADGVRVLVGRRSVTSAAPQGTSSSTPQPLAQQDTAGPPAVTRLRAPAQLASCVAELAGKEGVTALAVDYAQFQDEPAVVIVLADADPAVVRAWVVGPACSTGAADVRHYQVVPRAG